MSKVSYDEALDEMELMVRAIRMDPERWSPLARQVADELEAKIAEINAMRLRKQELIGRQMEATRELLSLVAQGKKTARMLRGEVILALGTTNALLATFGIPVRGRRRHKGAPGKNSAPAITEDPVVS